jgi:phosphoribosyl 1,2-cyclic phosphodiesterase
LESLAVDPREINGIVITHEHTDHIAGIRVCARTFGCPVYISHNTCRAMSGKLEGVDRIEHIEADKPFTIGDLLFKPFTVLHDAVDPLGLVVTHQTRKIGIATDLGKVTHLVREELRQAHVLILEYNHDEGLLFGNPRYPWALKQRIRGSHGHLSNEAASALVAELSPEHLQTLLAAHMSRDNNRPSLVRASMEKTFQGRSRVPQVLLLEQDAMSRLIEV